ncbi:T-cell receptor beta chain ANA 11 [Salpingoeca rosetta]|uniref:T-cell receptor beta chain ANA 11 n=1 Tax=Salpingoeca rosetta (strain ATCC 50818 / BSB-021) TaxID=946362 RepID=F2U8K0_SALR5|nr:T-cell receptor beta chain ANA 11 [Salpingoeca rosetta]EGD72708.1 T-cell receptor beta chain ANA 11 [Salpingoeca rosetta]|eukprot:XP_004994531.1 T-cell receptor beta chain ANA 11 [Salpingoeca rosetta]
MSKKLLKAAKAAIQAQEYDRALDAANQILDDEPDHFHALLFAAIAHAKLGDFTSAQQRYKDALAADSTQAVVHQGLAELYEARLRDDEDAEDEMLSLLKDTYNTLLTMQGNNATVKGELVLSRLSRVEDKLEHFQEAANLVRRAADIASEPAEKLDLWTRALELTMKREAGLDRAKKLSYPDPVARRRAIMDDIENDPQSATAPVISAMLPLVEQGHPEKATVRLLVRRIQALWSVGRMDTAAAVRAFRLGVSAIQPASTDDDVRDDGGVDDTATKKAAVETALALYSNLACDDEGAQLIQDCKEVGVIASLADSIEDSDVAVALKVERALNTSSPTSVNWDELQAEVEKTVDTHADTRDLILLRKHLALLLYSRDDFAGCDRTCQAALERINALNAEAAGRKLRRMWEWFTVMHAVTMTHLDTLHLKQHQTTLATHAENAFAQAGLARIAARWNKRDLAMMHAETSVSLDNMCGTAHAALAVARGMAGDVDGAVAAAKAAVDVQPTCADHHYQHGRFLTLQHQQRLRQQQQQQQQDGRDSAGGSSVAGTTTTTTTTTTSEVEIDAALPIPRTALRPWLLCLRVSRGHSNALYYIGCYYAATNMDKAVRCYAKALEAEPLHPKAAHALWLAHMRAGRTENADALVTTLAAHAGSDRLSWVWMRKALLELGSGDVGTAVVSLQTALRADTGSALLWQLLGEAYHRRGSFLAAHKAFDQCLERDPACLHAMYMKGLALLRLGDEEEAMHTFQSVLDIDNTHAPAIEGLASALYSNARTFYRNRRPELCLDAINHALAVLQPALHSSNPYVCLWKLCGDAYELATQLPPTTMARVQPIMFASTAAASNAAGEDAGAQDTCFAVLNACAAAAFARVVRSHATAGAYCDLAVNRWRLYSSKHAKRAGPREDTLLHQVQRLCMQALTLDRDYTDAWNMLGIAAFALQDVRLAYNSFANAATSSPSSASTWVHIGALFKSRGRTREAHRAFTQAQMLDPGKSRAWIGQALVAAEVQHEETLDLFRHALELYPHGSAARAFAFYTLESLRPKRHSATPNSGSGAGSSGRRGHVPTPTGDVPRGCEEQYLLQASTALIALTSTAGGSADVCVHNMCGVLYERLRLYKRAEQLYRQALDLAQQQQAHAASDSADDSDNNGNSNNVNNGVHLAVIKHNLARCLALQGSAECLPLFAQEVEAGTADTSTLCLYAKALLEQGDIAAAFQVYKHAHDASPGSEDRAEIAASMAVVAFANDEVDLAKQLLAEATRDPAACPPAVFITAALGLFAGDLQLAEHALAYGPQLWTDGTNSSKPFVSEYLRLSAFAYAMAGAPKVAQSFLMQLIHVFPEDASTWTLLAQVLCGGNPAPAATSAAVVALKASAAASATHSAREMEAAALLARGAHDARARLEYPAPTPRSTAPQSSEGAQNAVETEVWPRMLML